MSVLWDLMRGSARGSVGISFFPSVVMLRWVVGGDDVAIRIQVPVLVDLDMGIVAPLEDIGVDGSCWY